MRLFLPHLPLLTQHCVSTQANHLPPRQANVQSLFLYELVSLPDSIKTDPLFTKSTSTKNSSFGKLWLSCSVIEISNELGNILAAFPSCSSISFPLYMILVFLSFQECYFSPRRGCSMVVKFSIGSSVTEILGFQLKRLWDALQGRKVYTCCKCTKKVARRTTGAKRLLIFNNFLLYVYVCMYFIYISNYINNIICIMSI